eukprot:TRINITY_DN2753_c7_g1_i1.p1 TRINITY_DN2753_c7_g1~~TRINITY_DN2753_c7_g1_i1.p1  ORF type:complete len:371 (+),score=108.02 TRINITY_DN2753_c7_g1_i1:97-1209(+)
MARTIRSCAVLMAAVQAAGMFSCPSGSEKNSQGQDCCLCGAGFAQPGCDKCKAGYMMHTDPITNRSTCYNGITDCLDSLPYPYGCSGNGVCTKRPPPLEKYYACQCDSGHAGPGCIDRAAAAAAGDPLNCKPVGVHMYTQSPLEVTVEQNFNLLLWGCNLSPASMQFRVIPQNSSCDDAVPAECQATAAALKTTPLAASCTSIQVTGANILDDMSRREAAIEGLKLPAAAAGQGTAMYKLCSRDSASSSWSTPVQTHDERGYRDPAFMVVSRKEADVVRGAAGLGGDGLEWECCDKGEIRVGDACIPLIVWILLMLLLFLLAALLAYKAHKTNKEIEMERNNRQFNQFSGADESSLQVEARKRDGADDDV